MKQTVAEQAAHFVLAWFAFGTRRPLGTRGRRAAVGQWKVNEAELTVSELGHSAPPLLRLAVKGPPV